MDIKTYIKRQVFIDLQDNLKQKGITLISGSRQVGKTTLMLRLQEYLIKKGERTLFLSLDFEEDKEFFKSQRILLEKIDLELGNHPGYVFIDEIHRKTDAGLFLKGLYDQRLPYKFIVSGSGSLELKEKIHESLAGRKLMFEVGPVSFEEFVNYRTNYRYTDKLENFFRLEKAKTNSYFQDYLNFGGYPEVVLARTLVDKTKVINEIYSSYLEKDIAYLLQVEKLDEFRGLVRLLAGQIGGLVNYSEISNTLNISLPTVRKYFYYLEKTFVLKRLLPFARNIRKEISKSPVAYFADLGLCKFAAGTFGQADNLANGFIFQNFIFNELHKKFQLTGTKLNFWRTKDKAEVDFVLSRGDRLVPVEVKYQSMREVRVARSLRSFIERYQPVRGYIVTRDMEQTIMVGKTKVFLIPFWRLLFADLVP